MSVAAVLQRVDGFEKRLDQILVEAEKNIDPENQFEFAQNIKDALLRMNQELIEKVSKVACNSGVWGPIRDEIHQLDMHLKHERRRDELRRPSSPKNLTDAIKWMAEQGVEEDLRLLKELKDSLSFDSEEIEKLYLIAVDRISERINDPYYVISRGEEAYERNREQWEVEYAGRFIAIQGGKVIDSDRIKAELVRRVINLQQGAEPSRSFIVEVGAPVIDARGPKTRRKM